MSMVIQVIYTKVTKGNGTKENPFREVEQYWNFDGTLIHEIDHFTQDT